MGTAKRTTTGAHKGKAKATAKKRRAAPKAAGTGPRDGASKRVAEGPNAAAIPGSPAERRRHAATLQKRLERAIPEPG